MVYNKTLENKLFSIYCYFFYLKCKFYSRDIMNFVYRQYLRKAIKNVNSTQIRQSNLQWTKKVDFFKVQCSFCFPLTLMLTSVPLKFMPYILWLCFLDNSKNVNSCSLLLKLRQNPKKQLNYLPLFAYMGRI